MLRRLDLARGIRRRTKEKALLRKKLSTLRARASGIARVRVTGHAIAEKRPRAERAGCHSGVTTALPDRLPAWERQGIACLIASLTVDRVKA
jgi:hypothetical protein